MGVKRKQKSKTNKTKQIKPTEYINPFLKSVLITKNTDSFNLDEFLNQGIFNNEK